MHFPDCFHKATTKIHLVVFVQLVIDSSCIKCVRNYNLSHYDTNLYFLLFPLFIKSLFKFEGFGEWSWIFLGFGSLDKFKNHWPMGPTEIHERFGFLIDWNLEDHSSFYFINESHSRRNVCRRVVVIP